MKKYIIGILSLVFCTNGAFGIIDNPIVSAQQDIPERSFQAVENDLFPGWGTGENNADSTRTEVISGVAGTKNDKGRIFQYIPRIIELILKFTAPIVVVLVIIAGVKLIIGGDEEESIESAKDFFRYALIGIAFMILSYSIMKTIYSLLST